MKVCAGCGNEIYGGDGKNWCRQCIRNRNKLGARQDRERAKKAREAILKSLGLTKCVGRLGGVYWE